MANSSLAGCNGQAILQFVVIFKIDAGILYLPPNIGDANPRLEAARKPRARVESSKHQDNASASCGRRVFCMEVVFENGWNGNGWMLDRLASFRQAADAATNPNTTAARADVVEGKDAYHFYIEMPGLKGDSIDMQGRGDSLVVAVAELQVTG